jgi:nucleotide-binding universal stress UspA family protein
MRQLRQILVGVTPGSHESHPLGMAIELATRADACVIALSVTDPSSPRAGVPPALPQRVTRLTPVGIPAIEIARQADSGGADLIVLGRELPTGTTSRDGRETVEGTVRRARVPCLLAPRGTKAFRRVLAAVDGGPDAEPVIAAARFIARLFHAAVRALHVEEPVAAGAGVRAWSHESAPSARHWASEGECDTVVGQGDPVSEILRVVREDAVDLLVVGHHRGGPVSAHATSGVAARLLQRVHCAVLTVPI